MSEWMNIPERWDVEVSDGAFQPIGPSVLTVTDGGALVFRTDRNGPILIAYGTGAWKTVTSHEEA